MPRFVMTVAGEDIPLDTDHMMLREVDQLEKLTGWTVNEWAQALLDNRSNAVRFAYWLGRRRQGQPIDGRFSDIDLDMGEISWRADTGDDGEAEPSDPPTVPEGGSAA